MEIVCPCGKSLKVFDENPVKCPGGHIVSAAQDMSGAYQKALERLEATEMKFKRIVQTYKTSGDSTEIKAAVSATYGEYMHFFHKSESVWRDFITQAAGEALSKQDKELQTFLKAHAIERDRANGTDYNGEQRQKSLFRALLSSHPRLGSNNDWDALIISTRGDLREFATLCDSIVRYLAEKKDTAFALDIFSLMQAKSTDRKALDKKDGKMKLQQQHWIEICECYLRGLFSNSETANRIFTVEIFKGSARARKSFAQMIAYRNKYLTGQRAITIETTEAYRNYVTVRKIIKRRRTVACIAVLTVMAAMLVALNIYFSAVNKDTVAFSFDKVIEVTYGDDLSLDGYYLSYQKNSGEKVQLPLTEKMIFDYDPNKVGVQQTAYFEFSGVKAPVTIIVSAAQLETPRLTQSGNYVTWEMVPNADSYAVFVNATEVKANETSELRYDLSSNALFGELTVTVRATSSAGKYVSSEMSEPIKVTKLEAPKNFEYSNGKLTWSPVEGATGFELTVNGTPYVTTAPECTLSLIRGNNEITVIATSSDKYVINGVTNRYNLYYNRLDPISSMSYSNGSVYWQASEDAKMFRVYVDGVQWKDFSRNNFSFEHDGFSQAFGSGAHKIEIVCMTSASGVESSDKKGFNVIFGNKVTMSGGLVQWDNIGVGSTYFVSVNGQLHTYSDSYFSVSDGEWQEGLNHVSIVARLNGEEFICDSFTVTKHPTPALSATNSGWITDHSGYELYSVNGGAWTDTLPDISSIAPGTYTVKVKRTTSAADAFELESDTAQITLHKPKTPVIKLNAGTLEYSSFDSETFELVLEYFDADVESWTSIPSLSAIVQAGNYSLRAYLRAKPGAAGFDYYLSSDTSAEIAAAKPEAPDVIYDPEAGLITSSIAGAKFYYTDENGTEQEIVGGKVSNLPGGVFSVYARLNATQANTLHSENTPVGKRVSVFNLDIEFLVNAIAGSNQCYFVFKGCDDIDAITYSYKINYLNVLNQVIGSLDKSDTFVTQNKANVSSDTISALVNYRVGGQLTDGYTQSDIAKIAVTVYIQGGAEVLPKSYTTSVK